MKKSFYRRHGLLILLISIISVPIVIFGAFSATNSNENIVSDWLPPHFEETKRLEWFVERFGSTEMMVVTWNGCRLDDHRVDQFAESLRSPTKVSKSTRLELFERVLTGPEMFRKLTAAPFNLKPSKALERMHGWLIGSDNKTTCVVAILNKHGEANRHRAVDWVYQCANEVCHLSREHVVLAGPAIDSVAIDRTSTGTIRPLNFLCWGICLVIAACAIRAPRIAMMMFIVALFCQYLSLALVYYSGEKMNSILFMVASLVFVLVVSAAVHIVNYYREAIERGGLEGAPGRAIVDARLPCWLAAGTTALGMASLTISHIKPIYTFGVYAALGVVCGLTVLMLVFPSWLERWPLRQWSQRQRSATPTRPDGGPWRIWANLVMRFHGSIAAMGVVFLAMTGWGLTRLTTTVNLHDMFSSNARVIRDYTWVQQHVGPMVPIEVVLRLPRADEARILDRMQLVERVRRSISDVDFVGATISAASFGPAFPLGKNVRSTIRRALVNRELERYRDTFKRVHYLKDDPGTGEELWRISVRVLAQKRIDYGALLDQLEQRIDSLLQQEVASNAGITDVRAMLCGSVPLVNKAQSQLLNDLRWSFVTAFVFVGFTMVVLLRSVLGGVLSMIPNIAPSVIVFGLMGWFDVVVDIGAMMTASVALGIAVDDTLHFIVWFRRGLAEGYDRYTAVRYSFQRCGTAMLQTSLICGFGLLGFTLSPFVPISRFSWLMAYMLFGAVVGDLILLPALLAGPLGRFFESRPKWQRMRIPLLRPTEKLQQVRTGT